MQIHITFGLQLDNAALPLHKSPLQGGHFFHGPKSLVLLLESYLGLSGHPSDQEYLRIENYRQALVELLRSHPEVFYAQSFEADQFATAQELLARRDELLMNGWDFPFGDDIPGRLATLGQIEKHYDSTYSGMADRHIEVIRQLQHRKHPITSIRLSEPKSILPYPVKYLLDALEASGTQILPLEEAAAGAAPDTDLYAFQQVITGQQTDQAQLKGDGSLILLKGKTPAELSAAFAKLNLHNPEYRPYCLIPEKNRRLDDALIQEGLPAMGLQSASLARPVLQILKLAPAFLWDPIDPYKLLEFVNLALKPLDDDLAKVIAAQLASTPGLDGDSWRRAIAQAFDLLEKRYPNDKKRLANARFQYQFWFRRKRFASEGQVPKKEVIDLFVFIENWARELQDPEKKQYQSLLILAEQAKRIREILQALPEQGLSSLEVERIVRTIYEPAPIVFKVEQENRLEHRHHPGAFIEPVADVLWWNFIQSEPVHFFSKWYQSERAFLETRNIFPESPETENQRRIWLRKRPVLMCQHRLVLVAPETIAAENTIPHPLCGELEAAFGHLDQITWNISVEEKHSFSSVEWKTPLYQELEKRPLRKAQPFIQINSEDWLKSRKAASFTSLDALFYYPYQWVFRYQLKWRQSSILSVVAEETLMGNLAHRLFELLFKENRSDWNKSSLETWIEGQFESLLEKEGAVLLLYGKEPQKISFLNRLKYASWSLISSIQKNNWEVNGSEEELKGLFAEGTSLEVPMRGFADLLLKRGEETAIVDLKWGGFHRRNSMIKNEEDLQLILYSMLKAQHPSNIHTAYFIIRDGRMVARDNAGFKEVEPAQDDVDRHVVNQNILNRMLETYKWRMQQLQQGKIEIRTSNNQEELEEIYYDEAIQWADLLEMKQEDARYDEFGTLVR